MALKTIIKAGLTKYGILSIEMSDAFTKDYSVIDHEGNSAIDLETVEDVEDQEELQSTGFELASDETTTEKE